MMESITLLARLADRFVSQRENLATEALAFILQRSPACRTALGRFLSQLGVSVPFDLAFRTQAAADDQAIPDLVGETVEGELALIIEAKLWAGLTAAQPVDYVRRLRLHSSGLLAFLVPSQRAELLWHELVNRCTSAGIPVNQRDTRPNARLGDLQPSGHLALITWRDVLSALTAEAEAAGEIATLSDLRQLRGLCDREDAEAFLPVTSEELTGRFAKRVVQFSDLADDLTARLVDMNIADVRRLRAAAGKGWYGKYLRLFNVGCLLHFNSRRWGTDGFTPLWLRVRGPGWAPDRQIEGHLRRHAHNANVKIASSPEGFDLPVIIPAGVEREVVMAHALKQLETYARWLEELHVPPTPDATPPANEEVLEQVIS